MPDVSPRRRSSRTTQLNQRETSSSTSSTRNRQATDVASKGPAINSTVKSPSSPRTENSEIEDQPDVRMRQTRRQKREQDTQPEQPVPADPEEDDDDPDADADADGDGGDDITRCICRRELYPGPPVPLGATSKSFDAVDEEAGGLFISCDSCKVWQHGGCVGIMDQATTPENYYCEQCRSDLHKVMQCAKGYKYSQYLPVFQTSERSSSRTKSITKDLESRSSKERDNRSGSQKNLMPNGNRRSTMNSRAAYEEEEMIRRAMEESKGNGTNTSSSNGKRRSKRARNESEDMSDHGLKRRKTGSDSGSPIRSNAPVFDGLSEDQDSKHASKSGHVSERARGANTRGLSGKDMRKRERERELERAEAAGRRKGRAERRRGDDPEPLEEAPRPRPAARAAATSQKSSRPQSGTKPQTMPPAHAPTGASHKKGAKPAARRGKVGRNQYTKDRDAVVDARAEAARPSKSRDGEDGEGNHTTTLLPNGSKPSKPRHMNPNRVSMNELRKRVAGIMEFVSKTQVEMAGDKTPPEAKTPNTGANGSKSLTRPRLSRVTSTNGASKLNQEISHQADPITEDVAQKRSEADTVDDEVFRSMSSLQMMDYLSRDMIHWQQRHGKWGDKP